MFTRNNSRKKKLIRLAEHAGFPYSAQSSPHDYCFAKYTDGGLLTLSRYEILED